MRTLRLGGMPFLIRTLILLAVAWGATFTCASAQQLACMSTLVLADSLPTAIASIKKLPDGAYIYVNQKVVTNVQSSAFYIEEPDRSAGIKVDMGSSYTTPSMKSGNIVTLSGLMGTENGERVIKIGDVLECDYTSTACIKPLGMNIAAIMGWPVNFKVPDGDRITGLVPTGLYIKVWGRVTRKGTPDPEGYWYCYLDDGWGKRDFTDENVAGLRIYCNKAVSVNGDTLYAVGVLSTKLWESGSETVDDIVIPCLRTTSSDDLYKPGSESVYESYGPASGRVRLIGQSAPGKSVRIYSERDSIILDNVTDDWTTFTLANIPEGGTPVCASSNGYISAGRDVSMGDTDADFELTASELYIEMSSDTDSIAICSDEQAEISVLLRDCEGKGICGKQVSLTTTTGVFVENDTTAFTGTTDANGKIRVHLTAGTDGAGTAVVNAQTYPLADCSDNLDISLIGPIITMSASPKILSAAGSSVITASLSIMGVPLEGALITFNTNSESFVENGSQSYSILSDSAGKAKATLKIKNPGTVRVNAAYTDKYLHETISCATVAYIDEPWYDTGINKSHPLVVDLDGDDNGKKEVVVVNSDGYLVALDSDANVLWSQGKFGTGNNTPSCMPLDSERSGRPCVFVPSESTVNVCAYSYDGKVLAGWPVKTRYAFLNVACAIGDINLDGSPEMLAGDQCCYVWSWNPTGNWMATTDTDTSCLWVNLTGSANIVIHSSTCALGDMDNDENGIVDVVVGTVSNPGSLYGFPGDAWGSHAASGVYLDGWPKSGGNCIKTSPAIGDIDGDGMNDVAWGAEDENIHIWLSSLNSGTGDNDQQILCDMGGPVMSSPALADLDGDGKLDVIAGSDSGYVWAFNWQGQPLDGWSGGIRLDYSGDYSIDAPVSVGDANGDGKVEVVVACSDGFVYALYSDGANHEEGGKSTGPIAWADCCVSSADATVIMYNAPVIDDIDNDGLLDILVANTEGIYLFNLDVPYSSDASLYPWPTFHRDNQRTGCVTTPPSPVYASIQGIVSHDGTPISGAYIYIYKNDGSAVHVPGSDSAQRSYVLSVGSTDAVAAGVGAYCINQLDPNETYKIKVEAVGYTTTWVKNVAVTTGLTRVDVAL
ncbi:MAG: FG-GAP-like repeat-containing protein [Armatimonadota bacterium]|nr:FG-GAP-like repeat-containing protein [bacterium]